MNGIRNWACLSVAVFVGAYACRSENAVADKAPAEVAQGTEARQQDMKIRIVAKGRQFTAELEDSAAARDFAALLPLDLTLRDFHGTEKIADLPSRLSLDGAPDGVDPAPGDVAYYAPWGNLALFYRDFGYSKGLVRLGRIEGDVAGLAGDEPVAVRIERAPAP